MTTAAPEKPFDPLLTIDQLAEWLGKPKKTIYNWRHRGYGPTPIKVGNDLRFRRSVVDAWLDAQTEQHGEAA